MVAVQVDLVQFLFHALRAEKSIVRGKVERLLQLLKVVLGVFTFSSVVTLCSVPSGSSAIST